MRTLSAAQRQAISLLPCDVSVWEKRVRPATRRALAQLVLAVPRKEDRVEMKLRTRPLPDSYRLIRAEAQRVGWPTSYRRDLYKHDKAYLLHWQPTSFIWVLRQLGTHLVTAEAGFTSAESGPMEWLSAMQKHSMPSDRVYWFANGKLSPVSWEKARDLLQASLDTWIAEKGHLLDLDDAGCRAACERSYYLQDPVTVLRYSPETAVVSDRLGVKIQLTRAGGKLRLLRL